MESTFVKATNKKALLYAAIAVAAGIGVILLGAVGGITLSFHRLTLPLWVMYVGGGLIIGVGVLIVLMALDSEKCPKCGAFALNEEAYFPLELEKAVVQAVEACSAASLVEAQKVPKNQMKTVLYMSYCPGCGEVGELKVGKWENYRPHDVLPRRAIKGPEAVAFRAVIRAHAEWRGEG